jgi:tripartite-type tricarboxylate transporter receptor subunit TctC
LKELIQVARAHPGKLSFGSGGVGSSNHLANELFKSLAKVSIMNVLEVKRQLVKVEVEPVTSTPSEFGALFRKESETWARVIREANIKFE